jgi:hypothetical protein
MAIFAPAGGLSMEVSLKLPPVLGGAEDCAWAGTQVARANRRAAARAIRFIEVRRIGFIFLF